LIDFIKKHLPKAIKRDISVVKVLIGSIGAKYHCPACGCRIKHFQPLPEFYFNNAKQHGYLYTFDQAETLNYHSYSCPLCSASDRDRLYALYIQDYLANVTTNRAIKILDFAPSAPFSRSIRNMIALSGQKASYRTADLCMEGVDDKVDITDMSLYDDNQFDFFICSHILEHVSDDRKALSELYRILKPEGLGILMVPIILSLAEIEEDTSVIDESEKWRRFGQYDHVRLYSKDGFIKRVKEVGFLIHQYGKEYFGENLFARSGITCQSVLYVVEK
jgi:SAM-dependent methyltransferase